MKITRFLPAACVAGVVAIVGYAQFHDDRGSSAAPPDPLARHVPLRTGQADLEERIRMATARLQARPDDGEAAVLLGDAAVRYARATGQAQHTIEADQQLTRLLRNQPGNYAALRQHAVVLLSLHRFDDALAVAQRARDLRPDDAANYGAMGDAHLELGEYDEAFAMFQRMMDLRPNAASYARVAYARELQGNLDGAEKAMTRAARSTAPSDLEAQAWHATQLGDLAYKRGHLADARLHYDDALRIFADYPAAIRGVAHVKAASGAPEEALRMATWLFTRRPSLGLAEFIGNLATSLGDGAQARHYYELAEAIGRESSANDESMAAFLAEHGHSPQEAVALAERAAARRHDIVTEEALAWAYYKAGRLEEASDAIARARRTGSRDRRLLYHAAAIADACGQHTRARELAAAAVNGLPGFDPLLGPKAARLAGSEGTVTVASR
jgi:tetratricopeptide (TPR) repeat protein